MAVSYRTIQTSTTATVSKPASLANGDLMLAYVINGGTTVSLPSGWTRSVNRNNPDGDQISSFFKHVTTASSEPASWTFTSGVTVMLLVFYGHVPSSPIDQDGSAIGTSLSLSEAATYNGSMAVVGGVATTGASAAAPTGWTKLGPYSTDNAAIRRAVDAGQPGAFTWNVGTGDETGVIHIIRPLINVSTVAVVATASAGMLAPVVTTAVNALVLATVAVASADAFAPFVFGSAQVDAISTSASAEILVPAATGAALVVAAEATATGSGLAPELIYSAIVAATVAGAAAALAEPVVAGGAVVAAAAMDAAMTMVAPTITGAALLAAAMASATATANDPVIRQSIVASLMSATMMAHGSEARGGALVSPDVSAVIASIHTPLPQLIYSVPLMSMSASAFGATALGSAVTTTLLGVATASAVAPKAGVLRTTSAWRGNRMSVNGRVNTGSVTTRPSSSAQVTRNTNDASSTLRAGVTVSPSSPSGVTATQQERDE